MKSKINDYSVSKDKEMVSFALTLRGQFNWNAEHKYLRNHKDLTTAVRNYFDMLIGDHLYFDTIQLDLSNVQSEVVCAFNKKLSDALAQTREAKEQALKDAEENAARLRKELGK